MGYEWKMLLGKQDNVRGKKAEGTLRNVPGDIQKAKIKSKHGWKHINRALIEQGEREKEE